MATRASLYDEAFKLVERAQNSESTDILEAIQLYKLACVAFARALQLDSDPRNRELVRREMAAYHSKVEELEKHPAAQQAQLLCNEFDDPLTVAAPRSTRPVSVGSKSQRQPAPQTKATATTSASPPRPPPAPAERRAGTLSENEVRVLMRASTINGKVFQPWLEGEERREEFRVSTPFDDPDGQPPLSQRHRQRGAEWKRPSEFLSKPPVMIQRLDPLAIKQDLVTDCSFVASLCVGAALEIRTGKRIITGNIFPQERGQPVYNPSGKYVVRLWYNGIARKVIVDDKLPVDPDNRLLCSSASGGQELWVSIMEKAYMKLHGGYDFPGSNSGIDLFALSGWIPEQIFFEEDASSTLRGLRTASNTLNHTQSEDRAWERLCGAHHSADCLITISTGGFSTPESQQATDMGLIRGHAYAVLDVVAAKSRVQTLRMVKIKNPWGRLRWEGRFSSSDTRNWTTDLRKQLSYNPVEAAREDNGVFWMEFTDVRRFFRSFNVNWNPSTFRYRSSLHGEWLRTEGIPNDRYILGYNPQYSIRVPRSGDPTEPPPVLWVLVSRHTMKVEAETEGAFLAALTYKDTNGGRVYNHPRPYINDVYSNDPHHLVRIDVKFAEDGDQAEGASAISNEKTYTIVLSQNTESQGNQLLDVSYTINVYSSAIFEFYPTPRPPPHRAQLQSHWGKNLEGGRPSSPTYATNPMWHLWLSEDALCHFELRVPREIFAQIAIAGGEQGGRRIERLTPSILVCDSGDYTPAFAHVDVFLPRGDYTIIAGRFDPGPTGACMLDVFTGLQSVAVSELPR